mgnify:CR=1 FL=1
MKQRNKKIIAIAILALIILAGIVVVNILGFNKQLEFKQGQSIDVYVRKEIDEKKIKEIANEVLGKENLVQLVEIYKDMVTIRAEQITEEQKNNIVNKIKENYEFEQTAEETVIKTVPATRILDMYKHYVVPMLISGVIILAYMLIRYNKKGVIKVLLRTILIPIIAELVLLSLIAITRIPLGVYTPILVIIVYLASIVFVTKKNEE